MALNDTQIRNLKPDTKSYRKFDGHGLYIQVTPRGSKYWYRKFYFQGKETRSSYGPYPAISLAEARKMCEADRATLAKGINPNEQRKANELAAQIDNSFETVARKWHSIQSWSTDHAERVLRRMEANLFPYIGNQNISVLKTIDLLKVVQKVVDRGHLDVASRLRQYITAIMRYAVQIDIISYNPAQDLAGTIPSSKTQHRPALSLDKIPELLHRIDSFKGKKLTKLAVKLTLLIFIRSSELRFARWDEIDFEKKLWTIPAKRKPIEGVKYSYRGTKMRDDSHLVPLSDQAISILKEIKEISGEHDFIFVGAHSPKKPMSENTINKALRTLGYNTKIEVCGHGFRAMAYSALLESELWSPEALDLQMSHKERNSVKAAYSHKAQFLKQRRQLLQWWAGYLDYIKEIPATPDEYAKVNNIIY